MRILVTIDSDGQIREVDFGDFEDANDELIDQVFSNGTIFQKMLALNIEGDERDGPWNWKDVTEEYDHGTWFGSAGSPMPERERSQG